MIKRIVGIQKINELQAEQFKELLIEKIEGLSTENIEKPLQAKGTDKQWKIKKKLALLTLADAPMIVAAFFSNSCVLDYVANGSVDAFICSGDELWDFADRIIIAQEAAFIFSNC